MQLNEQYNITKFYFYDDNLIIWPELAEFCNKNCPPSFQWTSQANINDLRIDMIPLLSSAGCSRLSFGFESGSPAIQKYIGKVIEPGAVEKVSRLHQAGIQSRVFFMVGFPNETVQQMVETAKYIIKLRAAGLEDIAIFPARPFPGTRLLRDCLSIYGEQTLEDLLEFQYLEDFRGESDTRIRAKLHRYNTIPSFQINKYFDNYQVRRIIRALYEVFYEYTQFSEVTDQELATYLHLQTQEA